MINASQTAIYACFVSLAALTMLALTAVVAPGCSGTPSARPCDFVAIAKRASERFRGPSANFGFEVLDRGSAVYVHQPMPRGYLDGPPGTLIDKKSCRVCETHPYGTLVEDKGVVLLSVPAERSGIR